MEMVVDWAVDRGAGLVEESEAGVEVVGDI